MFFFNDTATTEIYTLSLHDALPISFTPDDAAVFFGRSDLVNDLISRVEARRRQQGNPFLTIVGPSGSGKSSLIRDRKSTRLNSSHANISYAVFCLKKHNSQWLNPAG